MNVREGRGRYVFVNRSDSYDGEWRDGVQHGSGLLLFGNGDVFIGDFRQGKR